MGAVVCNINPASPPPSSRAPSLPSIPIANDLASVIASVNAIRQALLNLLNQVPSNNLIPIPTGPGDFVELPNTRTSEVIRIYDQNDPTGETYIDVEQVTGLQLVNSAGQSWKWQQN